MESISFHLFNPLCVCDFVCLYYGLCRSRAVSLSLSIHPLYSFRSISFCRFLSRHFSFLSLARSMCAFIFKHYCLPRITVLHTSKYHSAFVWFHSNCNACSFVCLFFLSFVTFYSFVPLAIFSKRFRYFTTSSFVFDNVGLNQCILSFWMRKQGSPAPIIASPL